MTDAAGARPTLRAEISELTLLAGPLCLSHIGQQLLTVVDSAMLGRYSDAALGGAGLASAVFFAISVLGIGLVMGLDTLVPQALGAGKPGRARALYRSGVAVAVVIGVVLSGLCVLATFLIDSIGAEPEVAADAQVYLLARTPSVIPLLVGAAARSYLQAKQITRPIILATVVGNLINIVANALLIFGDRSLVAVGLPAIGLPELGAAGAGLASAMVSVAITVVLVLAVRAAGDRATEAPDGIRQITRLGTPVGLQLMFEVGIFATASAFAAQLGTEAAAAHQIALTLASFSFSIALGIGASTSVRVGHAVGRGDTPGARRSGLAGGLLGAGLMGLFAIVFVLMPGGLARLFSNQTAVVAAAIPLLQIAALFQLSDATQAVMAGALRGAGDTRATLIGNLAGHYLIGLPLMLILAFGMSMGAPGLWWALSAGLTAVGVALAIRFAVLTRSPIARS